jgi:hypothetical protein
MCHSCRSCIRAIGKRVQAVADLCQGLSRRAVSSGAAFALSPLVPVEVRDGPVHSFDVSLLDLAATVWTNRCIGHIWPGDHELSVG